MTDQTADETATPTFADLGLSDALLETVAALGYEEPSPIQSAAVPVLLTGQDVLGLAATGTGKTAAFSLPMIQRIAEGERGTAPRGLVLVPTRELALQVARAVHRYGKGHNMRVVPLYGGAAFPPQLKALRRGVDIVVATPGRALDHLQRGTLKLDEITVSVLDEADEMLDMGFQEDIEALLDATPKARQSALFSATFPVRLRRVADRHLTDPATVEVARMPSTGNAPLVRQVAVIVRRADKLAALVRILDLENPEAAIIFCRTRADVDELSDALASRGHRVEALHGGFSQAQRERVLGRLRGGANDLLIATDVAARGLDVSHLTHVFNYDLPQSPAQYVHRIGRTGRAGKSGMAVSLATRRERRLLHLIGEHTGRPVEILPVPRIEDLRRRQLARVMQSATESLAAGELDDYHQLAEDLLDGEEAVEVVAALLRMTHEARHGKTDDQDDDRDLDARAPRQPPAQRSPRSGPASEEWGRLWVSLGRHAGIRPGDLVGAITNEAGLNGKDIGAIRILPRFSLVDVRADAVQDVVEAMRGATMRNRPVKVREDRDR